MEALGIMAAPMALSTQMVPNSEGPVAASQEQAETLSPEAVSARSTCVPPSSGRAFRCLWAYRLNRLHGEPGD